MDVSSKTDQRLRYAIYARYSSDMQNELSLEDQEACCRKPSPNEEGQSLASIETALEQDGA